jgi:hypothetical protein
MLNLPKVSTLGRGVAATREAAVARAKMTAPKDFILSDLEVEEGKVMWLIPFFFGLLKLVVKDETGSILSGFQS